MNQGVLFLQMSVVGIVISIIFDITRTLRKTFKHRNFFVQIEDAIFWIVTCLGVLYFILNHAGGEIRFFYLLGIFLGALLYFITISSFVIKFFSFILRIIINFIKFIFKIIYALVNPILVLIRKILKGIASFFLTTVKRAKYKTKKSFDKSKNYGKMKVNSYKNKVDEKQKQKLKLKEEQEKQKEQELIKRKKEERLRNLEKQMQKARENHRRKE